MLTDIHIRHLATIEELHIDIPNNSTVITGETGAGKSILIEAIELALGERAAASWVRTGQEKSEIHLSFDIQQLPAVKAWLEEHDLAQAEEECLIRRVIIKDGRSRSYINGTPTTVQLIRELSEHLLHIHGQYEHQALLKPEKQRELLDHYAGHGNLTQSVKTLSSQWKTITQEIESLRTQNDQRGQRSDWLRFQLQELHSLNLTAGEWQELDEESRKLSNGKELINQTQSALLLLADNDERNATSLITDAVKILDSAGHLDSTIHPFLTTLQQSLIQLNDVENELRNYVEQVDLDPERLAQTEQRIGQLFHMARKHHVSPEGLVELQQKLETELSSLDNLDEHIQTLELKQKTIEKEYKIAANKLSTSREKFATQLSTEITSLISNLSFPHGKAHIVLEVEASDFGPYGTERVIFCIQINPGQPIQPIAKIASGGELSRISLAIHLATAEQHMIPTLIFDEVDVGVGGATAEKIGKLIRRLGENYQVLCITHHPQVASQGHQHLLVEKIFEKNNTFSHIRLLNKQERTSEIARMLGGETITQKTLEHAKELVGV